MMFHDRRKLGAINRMAAVSAAYVGPGDIVTTGWLGWWSPARAFKAGITVPAVRLHFADGTNIIYSTLAGGGVDYSSLASDITTHGAITSFPNMYDQSGTGLDLSLVSGTSPSYTASALGAFPGVTFGGNVSNFSTGNLTQSGPFSYSAVLKNTVSSGNETIACNGITGSSVFGHANSPPEQIYIYSGGAAGIHSNATLSAFHAMQAVLQSGAGNSFLNVDGVDSAEAGDIGTPSFSAQPFRIGADQSGGTNWNAVLMEFGLYNGSLFSSRSALNSNQHGSSGYSF